MPQTAHAPAQSNSPPVVNIAAYRFVRLENLTAWRQQFRQITDELQLRGTVLLSREGINLFVAGTRQRIDSFVAWMRQHPEFASIEIKESPGDHQPFNRMLVRLKKEIISMGVPEIDPVNHPSPKISAQTLKQWLDEGRPLTLLDTRNDYEIELGTFAGAIPAGVDHFRQFPEAIKKLPEALKRQPVVMFCTGGIRCEKAGPLMEREGFEQIYQLEGGILKYFEECGGQHYRGDCFVFDKRVAVNPELQETDAAVCFACQAVLTAGQQQDARYDPPHACPNCYRSGQEKMEQQIAARHQVLRGVTDPLPGSVPYQNRRPLNVPLRYDNCTLLEMLTGLLGHLGTDYWQAECDGQKLRRDGHPLAAGTVVRAGWRLEHWLGMVTEPDVNADIRIVYEDAALVAVNKPAPLPMHPSGRFNRNSLTAILNEVYAPDFLRPAHRLDANTTGIVILSRSSAAARRIQPQFESGAVEKIYIARVHGHSPGDEFRCDVPVGRQAIASGGRAADENGDPATTLFRVLKKLPDGTCLVQCRPLTGRTNQIRLHLAELKLPIVGDPVYTAKHSGVIGNSDAAGEPAGTVSVNDPPMCLHAWQVTFCHPTTANPLTLQADLPDWAV